jgi:hypothetical protein
VKSAGRSDNVFLRELGQVSLSAAVYPVISPPPIPASENIFLTEHGTSAEPPKPSQFAHVFAEKLAVLPKGSAVDFFVSLAGQLRRAIPDGMRNDIQGQVSIFLMRHPTFVTLLLQTDFMALVDFGNVARFEINLRLAIACLVAEPHAVILTAVAKLVSLANVANNARRLLKFFQLFLRFGVAAPDAIPVLSLFIENCRFFLIDHHFIRLLYLAYGCKQFECLRPNIYNVFREGLVSRDRDVVHAAALVICRFPDGGELPMAEILERFAENQNDYLSVLAHLPSLPLSTRLVQALLSVASSPVAIVLLCRLATIPEGAAFMLQTPGWTQPGLLIPADAVALVLTLGQHLDARSQLADVPGIVAFLVWLAGEATEYELESLAPLLRRIRITPEFFAGMEAAGFFRLYFTRTLESADLLVRDAAVVLMDKYGRLAWAPGFSAFIDRLPDLFRSGGQLAVKALVAAIVLAGRPQAKPFFAKSGVASMLNKVSIDERFEGYRTQLLQMIG